jgi:hypothetical protein
MRLSTISLSLAALSLGTALATVGASAQTYPTGRNANDGGMVAAQSQTGGQRTGTISNDQASRPNGDIYAFGGQGQPPAGGSHYPVGRNANDGGLTVAQMENGAQRTGSNSNREAFRSGGETYAFGAQGQPPRSAPGAYGTGGLYSYAGQSAPPASNYPVGRNANDGGLTTAQMDKGAMRTGIELQP